MSYYYQQMSTEQAERHLQYTPAGILERNRRARHDQERTARERDRQGSAVKAEDGTTVKQEGKRGRDSPPPPQRKRVRKTAWDITPRDFELGVVSTPVDGITPAQARQARRIYVGNIPLDVSEEKMTEFLTQTMQAANLVKNNVPKPIMSLNINRERKFALVEFADIDDATSSLTLNGTATLDGFALKLRRPKDYKPLPTDSGAHMATIITSNVPEGPNKLFIGGLAAYLNEEQVKELLTAFGALKGFNLVKDTASGTSKGFAFFEYLDPEVTDRAIQGLNGMKLGEKTILVQRASVGAKLQQATATSSSILTNPTAMNFLNLHMPIAAAAALLAIDLSDIGQSTRILCLGNVSTLDELIDDDAYDDILEDMQTELKKFGSVLSMVIPRPPKPQPEHDLPDFIAPFWGVGRVFVEYRFKEEAENAQKAMAARRYNGRFLLSGYFPEDRYEQRLFHPNWDEERECAARFLKMREDQQRKEEEKEVLEAEPSWD